MSRRETVINESIIINAAGVFQMLFLMFKAVHHYYTSKLFNLWMKDIQSKV